MTSCAPFRVTAAGLILLGFLARPSAGQDSTFLLVSEDPARTPSPFLGNGRVGVVIPPLGLGASASFVAGLYDHAPSDVPRIVAAPAWRWSRSCRERILTSRPFGWI